MSENPLKAAQSLLLLSLLTIFCGLASGCAEEAGVPAPVERVASPDEKVLQLLEYYEPMYKVNGQGRVIRLRLIWRHVPTSVATEIGKLTELQGIDLAGTTLTDEGLAQLKDLQKLRSIGLGNTNITDEGLANLAKLSSLQWVWVTKRSVTPQAVEKLKAARPDMNVHLF